MNNTEFYISYLLCSINSNNKSIKYIYWFKDSLNWFTKINLIKQL